jgi:hypothetical protein
MVLFRFGMLQIDDRHLRTVGLDRRARPLPYKGHDDQEVGPHQRRRRRVHPYLTLLPCCFPKGSMPLFLLET